ncbi:MAG: hypothetical protein GQ564_21655 [Bacteroidales bacterium]|nr:hypothetical protein [Bacteroidales bacterium]
MESIALPRTLSGLIKLNHLTIKLPSDDLSILHLYFAKESPEVSCILDSPFDSLTDPVNDWHFIGTAIDIPVVIESETEWPSFVSVKIEIPNTDGVQNNHDDDDNNHDDDDDNNDDDKEKKDNFLPITPKDLFSNYLGFNNVQKGDTLTFSPDGLTIQTRNQVPWKAEGEILIGKFRLGKLQSSQVTYFIEIENDPVWLNSLRTFQTNVICATEQIKTENIEEEQQVGEQVENETLETKEKENDNNGIPTNDSPGLGLVSSIMSRTVKWHLKNGALSFVPDQTLFEGEIRGAAGGAARIGFQEILILNNGQTIKCKSGEKEEDNAHLNYRYNNDENLWTGEFEASIEHDSQELIAELAGQYGYEDEIVEAWIQTDTGALKLPILERSNILEKRLQTSSESIFKGLVRLSEVPWVKESDELPASPDISKVKYSSLLLLNADSFEVSFSFFNKDDELVCNSIDGVISEPNLRLEDFLPVYLPPENGKNIFDSSPPDFPLPVEDITVATDDHFVGLSLIREKDFIPNASGTSFKVKISYQPGKTEGVHLNEGRWIKNETEIIISETQIQQVEYWFRPASLKWIPGLPLYGDPRKTPEEAVSPKRSYMPLGLGKTENSHIVLSPGSNWQVPILKGGFKVLPQLSGEIQNSIYYWIIPELPGISLVLLEDTEIRIENGLPVGGNIHWIWRHDIPVLDELNALRTTEDGAKNDDSKSESKSWKERLTQMSLLTKSRAELLLEAGLHFDNEEIIKVVDKAVVVQNLFKDQNFAGKANLNVLQGTASLTLDSTEGDLQLIPENDLLKGPGAFMNVQYEGSENGFKLTPSKKENTPVEIKAGTLLPFQSEINNEKVTVDHGGNISFAIENDKVGRQVMIFNKAKSSLEKVFLWSHQEINLSTEISQLKLNFSGLPLFIENDKWVYDVGNNFLQDEQLRNFRWSTIGNVEYWGLSFQLFSLVRVEFLESQNTIPTLPSAIHLEGVLHFRDSSIKMADSESQKVEITILHKNGKWNLERFSGNVLWPLFGKSPDLSSTSSSEVDSFPMISGSVRMERNEEGTELALGLDEEKMKVSFLFMERTWQLPIQLNGNTLKGIERDDQLEFKLIPSEEFIKGELIATEGNLYLKRKDSGNVSNLRFRIQVAHDSNVERALVDLQFNYQIKKTGSFLNPDTINVMSLDTNTHLVSLLANEIDQIQLSPGKISLVINKKEGEEIGLFELLPGWKISNKAGLHGYISLDIVDPPSVDKVSSAPLNSAQIIIETGIETPDLLSAVVHYGVFKDQPSKLEIKLTGILKLQNLISWSLEDGTALSHETEFVLRQASLSGERLDTTGSAFFRPKYIENKNDGLSGMIEVPCLAKHKIIQQKEDEEELLLEWTAPQNIRFASPQSFTEEVLLRGNKTVLSASIVHSKKKKEDDKQFKDIEVNFEPSNEIEQGFLGALGDELAKVLVTENDLMIIDATEAFWLRPGPEGIQDRSEIELWRQQQMALVAIPTFHDDYDDSGKTSSKEWYRLAIPFITDTTEFIASQANERLNELLSNKNGGNSTESDSVIESQSRIPRSRLLNLSQINQFSLDHQPKFSEYKSVLDQVVLDPAGYEKLVPFTSSIVGFEPGWLSFRDWQLNGNEDTALGIPFGSTHTILTHLIQSVEDKNLMAATELVPNKNSIKLPTEDEEAKVGTYFYMSPVHALYNVTVPVKKSSHLLKQLAGTPRVFIDWKGLKSVDELDYIPMEVEEKVLEWVNNLSKEELRAKVPDAPGGYSITEEGYGIGTLVIDRIKKWIVDNGSMTNLNMLLEIKGFGIDKISDLIYAVASEMYVLNFDTGQFQEVRVQLEFWLPAKGTSTGNANSEFVLASKNIFLLGIEKGDSWETVLFPTENTENESKLQVKVWEWVAKETTRLNTDTSPLLRASLMNPSSILGQRTYYLMDSVTRKGSVMKTKPQSLSVAHPMIPDPRLEFMVKTPLSDTMLAGPELLAGKVYYEPRTLSDPFEPVVDNDYSVGIIYNASIEPEIIEKGEMAVLKWKNAMAAAVLELSEKGKEGFKALKGIEKDDNNEYKYELVPNVTTIYVLRLKDETGELDRVEVSVRVKVPAAGSALGLNYKFTGIAPGMHHPSRMSAKNGGYQNWVEMTRDLRFKDFTRKEELSVFEPGTLLPASRKIGMEDIDESPVNLLDMNPFLAVRASHIYASGKPGGMMRFRTAMLTEDSTGIVRRKGSWAHDIRYPRPVPLPRELYPFNPDLSEENDAVLRASCKVETRYGAEPFTYRELSWQDPIYNRRLHAVAQEKTSGYLSLGLDRSVYAGNDVCYPEIKILEGIEEAWSVELKVKIQREIDSVPEPIEILSYTITPTTVLNSLKEELTTVKDGDSARYVFEIGIGDIDLTNEDENFVIETIENEDQLIAEAIVFIGGEAKYTVVLNALIRTDKDVWSQPQNAFSVIRNEGTRSEIAAFGWIPKPKIVKRKDRFRADSWEGTFKYQDVFIQQHESELSYEIKSFTAYGEMMM